MKRLIVAIAILALLIVANIFRFDTEATKTTNFGVTKWVKDRWTGQLWVLKYTANTGKFEEDLPSAPNAYYTIPSWEKEKYNADLQAAKDKKVTFTYVWYGLLYLSLLWTIFEIYKTRVKINEPGE